MTIGITGATGFIGRYLLMELARDHDVIVATAKENICGLSRHPHVRFAQVHYNTASYQKVFAGCKAVVHLGAKRSSNVWEQSITSYFENLESAEELFRACCALGISNVVNLSSVAVYDSSLPLPFRESQAPAPLSYYGISKLAVEGMARLYNKRYGMKIKSLRVAQVLGLGERGGYMPDIFLQQCLHHEPLTVYGQGIGGKEYIYVKDVARAISCALAVPESSGVYNIGTGVLTTNRELAAAYCTVFENTAGYHLLPSHPERIERFYTDVSLAGRELGFHAAYTLKEALEDMQTMLETESPVLCALYKTGNAAL